MLSIYIKKNSLKFLRIISESCQDHYFFKAKLHVKFFALLPFPQRKSITKTANVLD